MALVSFLPAQRVEIPHEPGNWMEFRKPSSTVVREARKVAESEGRQGVRDFGAEIVKAFSSGDDDEKAARRADHLAKLQEYDPSQFDRATLLAGATINGLAHRGAISTWGGPAYTDPTGAVVAVTAQSVGDLDEATARWAVDVVIGLMRADASKEADKSAPAPAVSGA